MRLSTQTYIEEQKQFIKKFGISKKDMPRLLELDYENWVSMFAPQIMVEQMEAHKYSNKIVMHQTDIFDLMEAVYFYKRAIHLITSRFDWDDSIPIDTSVLSDVNNDFIIDTINDSGTPMCVKVSKRTYPIHIRNNIVDWSVTIFTEKHPEKFTFHFYTGADTHKVFVLGKNKYCENCGGCKYCSTETDLLIRGKHKNFCQANKELDCDIFSVLYTALQVIDAYVNRKTVVKNLPRYHGSSKIRSIMVANVEGDSEVSLPLIDYVYEYRESVKREYKGGHHKSPVSHDRRGYYRKAKRGNYIRKDGEFIEVPKGTGNFTHVRATKVNPESDFVTKIIM